MAERTLLIIKPDAVEKNYIGNIIAHVEKEGFKVISIKMLRLTKKEAEKFYEVHKERPFYDDLTNFMSSGPCVPIVLERENAISKLREVIGDTDSKKAKEGTIRNLYGTDKEKNAVHASDSPENAKKEISFFFSDRELI